MQAPTDGQVSQETALAQQITKGQAREIMQKYMPVPETALQTHCSSLVSTAMKYKQMHAQVWPPPLSYICSLPCLRPVARLLLHQQGGYCIQNMSLGATQHAYRQCPCQYT